MVTTTAKLVKAPAAKFVYHLPNNFRLYSIIIIHRLRRATSNYHSNHFIHLSLPIAQVGKIITSARNEYLLLPLLHPILFIPCKASKVAGRWVYTQWRKVTREERLPSKSLLLCVDIILDCRLLHLHYGAASSLSSTTHCSPNNPIMMRWALFLISTQHYLQWISVCPSVRPPVPQSNMPAYAAMLGHHHPKPSRAKPSVNLTMHCNPGGHILRDTQLNVSDQMDRNATQQRCGEARGGVGDWCTIQCSGQPPVDTLVKGVRTDGRSLIIIIIIISEVTHIQYVGNPIPIVVGWSVGSFPRRPLRSKWMFTFQSFCCSTYCTNIYVELLQKLCCIRRRRTMHTHWSAPATAKAGAAGAATAS